MNYKCCDCSFICSFIVYVYLCLFYS